MDDPILLEAGAKHPKGLATTRPRRCGEVISGYFGKYITRARNNKDGCLDILNVHKIPGPYWFRVWVVSFFSFLSFFSFGCFTVTSLTMIILHIRRGTTR